MPSLSARAHIAFGLCSLVGTVLLLASFTGVVPDEASARDAGRAQLAETVGVGASLLLERNDSAAVRDLLAFTVERSNDLTAIVLVRGRDGNQLHVGAAESSKGDALPAVVVPLYRGANTWGELQFFTPAIGSSHWWAFLLRPPFSLLLFAGFCCLPIFYVYLGRMLKELNPSRAVPERVRSALDTIAEALLVIDQRGDIVLANAAFAELTGQSAESLLGRPARQLPWMLETTSSTLGTGVRDKSTDPGATIAFPWERALLTSQTTRNDMVGFEDGQGQRRTFIVNSSPVLGTDGRAGGVLISMDDVTLLEHKEMQLRESRDAAHAASLAKSQFLSNMSHEIRTPMTAILGFTDVLKRGLGIAEQDQQRHLSTIARSGRHLLELINDILDLSKVESGALEVESVVCSPATIVHDVIEVMRVQAVEKGIELHWHVAGFVPQSMLSDPARVRQILTNLVGNAIKFTEQGRVSVELGIADAPSEVLIIRVIDTGIGMSAAQQLSVFEAFTQADASISRRFGGTGLGLSISRQLAQALGGGVNVHSRQGQGSTFTIELPVGSLEGVAMLDQDAVTALVGQIETPESVQWRIEGARVLVVDDAPENRELLELVLGDMGLKVCVACDGRQALEHCARTRFDCILMDIQMPVMDGFEAVGHLRRRGFEQPVVALTANAMKGYERRILAGGFSHYMTKPIDLDRLGALLGELLDGERARRSQLPHGITHALPANSQEAPPEVDNPVVSSLLSKNPRFEPIVERFMPRLAEQVQAMEQALVNADHATLAELAHWLKGAGGNVGFEGFTALASTLEQAAKQGDMQALPQALASVRHYAARVAAGWQAGDNSLRLSA